MTITLASVASMALAPAGRSGEIIVDACSARSRGSSPASAALIPLQTSVGPLLEPPYPRVRKQGFAPSPLRSEATAMVVGVLPPPPAVKLPMQITGRRERYGVPRAPRASAILPQSTPRGASAEATKPLSRYHQDGVLRRMF